MVDENLILFLQTFIQTFIQLCVEEVLKWFEKTREEKKKQKENKSNPRMISLYSDMFDYFKEFFENLQSVNGWVKSEEWKVLLWLKDADLDNWTLSVETLEKMMNDKNSPINFHLENYMRNWDYVDVIDKWKIKLDAYGNILKECIDKYLDNNWENNGNQYREKLKKERELFDEYLSDNLIELKKVYVDIIIGLLYPWIKEQDKRYIMYEVVDRLDFEKYMPIIKDFLDKIDNRVLVK